MSTETSAVEHVQAAADHLRTALERVHPALDVSRVRRALGELEALDGVKRGTTAERLRESVREQLREP